MGRKIHTKSNKVEITNNSEGRVKIQAEQASESGAEFLKGPEAVGALLQDMAEQASDLVDASYEVTDEIIGEIPDAAPGEYMMITIGETMLSVCSTLRQLSVHDVMVQFPELIQDLVNDAYIKGYKDAKGL